MSTALSVRPAAVSRTATRADRSTALTVAPILNVPHLTLPDGSPFMFRVTGGSRAHVVSIAPGAGWSPCTCEDTLYRPGVLCKHRLAVAAHLYPGR